MFLHYKTEVQAPAIRADLKAAFDAHYAPQRDSRPGAVLWDMTPYPFRRFVGGGRSQEDQYRNMLDKLSTPVFTLRLPDVGHNWRASASERNAWINEEWNLLALPGEPPERMLQRQFWRRLQVRSGSLNFGGVRPPAGQPILALQASRYGWPEYTGHVRVLLRKDF